VGQTTKDGVFTLSTVEDLGSCGTCPVVQVNDTYYENMTIAKVDALIAALREGTMPEADRTSYFCVFAILTKICRSMPIPPPLSSVARNSVSRTNEQMCLRVPTAREPWPTRNGTAPKEASRMAETQVAQPANLALQMISYHRSRLQQTQAGRGAMLAVGLTEDAAQAVIAPYSDCGSIAAINSPSFATLSGAAAALQQIADLLAKRDIFHRFLRVEVAYHVPQMDPLREEFMSALAGLHPKRQPFRFTLRSPGHRCRGRNSTRNIGGATSDARFGLRTRSM
jgi:hypothetical protein